MADGLVIFAAFSAYTAIVAALGYVAGRLRAEYRVMRMLANRTVETRIEHAREREAQIKVLTASMTEVTKAAKAERAALERERAELAKAKGMVA